MSHWYGQTYPSETDLTNLAEDLGACVLFGRYRSAAFVYPVLDTPPMLIVPTQHGPLATIWGLAHELGHLRRHGGPGNVHQNRCNERQANHWAACALIPQARIDFHQNACMDTFLLALSTHYEPLPKRDCPARRFAARIAQYRLDALLCKLDWEDL